MKIQAAGLDPVELFAERQAVRPTYEKESSQKAEQVFGSRYSPVRWMDAQGQARRLQREDMEEREMRMPARQCQRTRQAKDAPTRKKQADCER